MKRLLIVIALATGLLGVGGAVPVQAHPDYLTPCQAFALGRPVHDHLRWWATIGWEPLALGGKLGGLGLWVHYPNDQVCQFYRSK